MFIHNSILTKEMIKRLDIKKNGIYVDATLGLGGHSEAILNEDKTIKLIAFDQDIEAINFAKKRLKKFENITYVNKNFNQLEDVLNQLEIRKVDGILFDLGTSFYQLTTEDRGFTYHGENIKLDMRMNQNQEKSAIEIINEYDQASLARIFKIYGEDRYAHAIARAIVKEREIKKITTNTKLNEIIKSVKGYQKDKHPSKNIYQAIRIEVNEELENLKSGLKQGLKLLNKNGVVVVLTFHSLEDRITKEIFIEAKKEQLITPFEVSDKFKTSKTIYPTKEEILNNNSARSARLRSIKKYYE